MSLVLDSVLAEPQLARLAELLALKAAPGDCLLLAGDLGSGKTTFARAFIRAALADPEAEVPSPTFPLLQLYATPRFEVAHLDLYRLTSAAELDEIGFDEIAQRAVTLVEWPQRAREGLPGDCIEVALADAGDAGMRHVRLAAGGRAEQRVRRAAALYEFLARSGEWPAARVVHLQGDASTRSYARLLDGDRRAVLMDAPRQPDGPPLREGRAYSRIAHLAEDVRPFVAVGEALRARGLAAPALIAHDLEAGFLLLEDLGDLSFGAALQQGMAQAPLWSTAVDVLVALRRTPLAATLPLPDASSHTLPRFDRAALEIEVELLLDWYWPAVKGSAASETVRAEFKALWSPVLDRILAAQPGIFLRDFHSPNLFWLPGRTGLQRVGLIDYQDALAEHWAYDLVSLLQDARVDVPAALEQAEYARYCGLIGAADPAFDPAAFAAAYADFGAQRNTRLIGLWVRLLRRDGKPQYLAHMPRTWDYVARNLAHPRLADLRAWYALHFPQDVRSRPITA